MKRKLKRKCISKNQPQGLISFLQGINTKRENNDSSSGHCQQVFIKEFVTWPPARCDPSEGSLPSHLA